MQNIINEAPEVAKAFWNLTEALEEKSVFDLKTKELILVGIFAAHNALRGVGTHVQRAVENGATKDEIVSAILLAIPVVGIPYVTSALSKALETIGESR